MLAGLLKTILLLYHAGGFQVMEYVMELVDPMTMCQLPSVFCCKVGPLALIPRLNHTLYKVSEGGAG